jgi:hypothetical protein
LFAGVGVFQSAAQLVFSWHRLNNGTAVDA